MRINAKLFTFNKNAFCFFSFFNFITSVTSETPAEPDYIMAIKVTCQLIVYSITTILPGSKTPQAVKLTFSYFKDTPLGHIFLVIPLLYILSCYHNNQITNHKGSFYDNSVLCKDIELKFCTETTFEPLNSKVKPNSI